VAIALAQCGKGKELDRRRECIENVMTNSGTETDLTGDLVANVTKVYNRLQSELDIVTRSVTTFVMSDVEDQVLQSQGVPASKMKLISNIYPDESNSVGKALLKDENSYIKKRNGAIFVGSFQHVPNVVAVKNLIRVTDAIRAHHPDFVMHIVGSHQPPDDLHHKLKHHRGIRFHGFMPDGDLTALYSQVLCAIVPLSTGAGVKGKVAAAYLHGIPVIGSRIALEGMGLKTDVACFLAEEIHEYVESYSKFRQDPQLARQFASRGLENIASTFSYSRATQLLDDVLKNVIDI
jgi:glycosyltransferase involved in cell wall biosynthesis